MIMVNFAVPTLVFPSRTCFASFVYKNTARTLFLFEIDVMNMTAKNIIT